MFKERTFLLHVALLIVLISCSPLISGAQVNSTVTIPPASTSPTVVEISDADALEHAQRNLDRSLSILNIVATFLSVFVTLFTVLVIILIACGFLEMRNWRLLRDQTKEMAEEVKKYADEVKPIIDRLKKAENEIANFRQQSKQLPISPEALSKEDKKYWMNMTPELNY